MSSAVLARPAPALADRLAGVARPPVRALWSLLDRPGVVSLAGGPPAPELFDLDGVRAADEQVLWARRPGGPSSTGPPRATGGGGRGSPPG